MAEIIVFGDKRGNAGRSSSAVSLAVQTVPARDWDNQELADLYRVKRLLDQAGVLVEADRGVTDEGEPWFVFCHPDGEVFVHLCRLDGEYMLDGTSIDTPLRGDSFSDLINEFVNRAIQKRSSNIVSLRPGDGVFLHPAVMLTALIWSMFVASDELVGIANGAEIEKMGADYSALIDTPLTQTDGAFGILQAAIAEQDAIEEDLDDASGVVRPNAETAARELLTGTSSSNFLPNPISLSLTAIAVTFGMSSKSSFQFLQNDQTELTPEQTNLFAELGLQSDSQASEVEQEIVARAADADAREHANVQAVGGQSDVVMAQSDLEVLNVPDGFSNGRARSDVVDTQNLEIVSQIGAQTLPIDDVAPSQTDDAPAKKASTTSAAEKTDEKPSTAKSSENTSEVKELTIDVQFGLDIGQEFSLDAYKYDSNDLLASFDLSSAHNFDLSFVLDDVVEVWPTRPADGEVIEVEAPRVATGETIRSTVVSQYSDEAISFVKFLLAKNDSVEMVVLKGKIILVDMSAFDDVTDISYLRSWSYDDVGIISTIGHIADFEAFDLVTG